jgi:hypothetical protein
MTKEMGFLIALCGTSALCYVRLSRAAGSVPSVGSSGGRR